MGEKGFTVDNKDGRTLLLCHKDKRDHEPALVKQGWTIRPYALPSQTGSVNDVICTECKTFTPGVQVKVGSGPWVRVLQCKACDTRRCGAAVGLADRCRELVTDRDSTKCAKGHDL
jgi:hypothetical protein